MRKARSAKDRRMVTLGVAGTLGLALMAGVAFAAPTTTLSIKTPKTIAVNTTFKVTAKGNLNGRKSDNVTVYYDSQKCAKDDTAEFTRSYQGNATQLIQKKVKEGAYTKHTKIHFTSPGSGNFCAYLVSSKKHASRAITVTG